MIDFTLDKNSPVPFYRQIADIILAGISSGRMSAGDQLPTIRDLAVRLRVNPNTVVKAFSQLQVLGVLDTQQGSGVYVRRQPEETLSRERKEQALVALCSDFVSRAQLLNVGIDELIGYLAGMRKAASGGAPSKSERSVGHGRV